MCKDCNKTPCSKCNKCNECKSTVCKCNYSGPNYTNPEVYDGQDINEAISNIAEYLSDINFEDGVGIVDVTNNGDGTFTITLSDGTTYNVGNFTGPQGPQGEDGPQGPIGPPGPEQLIIQNTLIVAKNGNNATAVADDWTKPFLTVSAASAAASAGDLIIVFPGIYNENNFIKTDVNYDFKLGVTMISTNDCINDSSGTMNINIVGEGNFYSSSGRGMLLVNPSTNIYMRLRNMVGFSDGIAIGNANKVDIKGEYISGYGQYTATIRGSSIGKIHFDVWDGLNSSSGASSIFFVNHSVDSQIREFEITGDILNSNSTAFGALVTDNCPGLKIKADLNIVHTSGLEDDSIGAINIRSGALKYTGKAISTENTGVVLSDIGETNSILHLKDTEIISSRSAVRCMTAGSTYFRADETIFRSSGDGVSTILLEPVVNDSQVILRNSDIYNTGSGTGADGIYAHDQLSIVRLSDVKIVVESEPGFLMDAGVSRTVDIESVVSSNKNLSGNVTNGITGSLLVVDANIEDNSFNF